jgi:hypothetical protein
MHGARALSPACGGELEKGKSLAHARGASPSPPSPASGGGSAGAAYAAKKFGTAIQSIMAR